MHMWSGGEQSGKDGVSSGDLYYPGHLDRVFSLALVII